MIFQEKTIIVFAASLTVAVFCSLVIAYLCFLFFSGDEKLFLDSGNCDLTKTIIYVPGWQNINTGQNAAIENIRLIFPQSPLFIEEWGALGDFESCIKKADQEAARLAQKIARFPESQRKRTIIIGHSLGGANCDSNSGIAS